MQTQSPWLDTEKAPAYSALIKDLSVDVAIIGGGITGITAAMLLQRAGKSVAVIEYASIGGGETGHTTAHLTEVIDTRYHELISKFGIEGATLARESSRAAIEKIAALSDELRIKCDFERVPAFLFTEQMDDAKELEHEVEAMRRVGMQVLLVESAPLPWSVAKAIEIRNQAQFNPEPYIRALTRQIVKAPGCHVFENTRVIDVQDGKPCHIATENAHITATDVIVAAHTPITNMVFLHTKIAAYRTYALAAPLREALPKALCWDTADPYHYIRSYMDDSEQYLIVGGEDHKTGTKTATEQCYEKLEHYAREHFKIGKVKYRWSGQILEPVDGLPYIGRNSMSEHVYVATGYTGNGMTFGTLAGMLLTDQISGVANEWSKLYEATRIHPLASAEHFISENVDFPAYFIKDRLTPSDVKTIEAVGRGEGKLVTVNGEKTAVYRDEAGRLSLHSAVCPHLGCIVHWNNAETTWDCPCHGSRFDCKGKLINGPATSDLKPIHQAAETHVEAGE